MMKTPPAWQEILLLNYRERLAAALSEMNVRTALVQALHDTALDVAGSGTLLDETASVSFKPIIRRRGRPSPPP